MWPVALAMPFFLSMKSEPASSSKSVRVTGSTDTTSEAKFPPALRQAHP